MEDKASEKMNIFQRTQLDEQGVLSGRENIVKAARSKCGIPNTESHLQYDPKIPLEAQFGLVPLTQPKNSH